MAEGGIDLLLSDLGGGMPGEDGMALHGWLREAYPALAARTVFVTGDTPRRARAGLPPRVRAAGDREALPPASLREALAALDR